MGSRKNIITFYNYSKKIFKMENNIVTNIWQKSKTIIKGLIIVVLVLLLLIPTYFVQDLIREREVRQKEAFDEVSSKWADRQNIAGPVLVIPYNKSSTDNNGKPILVKSSAYFLPDQLTINSTVTPIRKYRGIYQVMLYSSVVSIKGNFSALPIEKLKLVPEDLIWNEAYLCVGISDAKGLKEEMKLNWNSSDLSFTPANVNNAVFKDCFVSPVSINFTEASKEIKFSGEINFNGSQQLLFTPVGRQTEVQMQSSWPDPSFTGGRLPDTSVINKSGFTAKWKSLFHTRNFPQAWKDESYDLSSSSFGTDLFIPVNGYQKTMRAVKYAILCILLTFVAFFLIETNNKKSAHPLQYALIGFALVLFYTLLLSFSEYIGFNAAYAVATVATIGLITWFVKGILQSGRSTSLLSVVLILVYSYVFTILQLQDYSLLLGSIGLFLTLAVIMYFSRKIQW
jgi:inner membrane protein